MGYIPLSLSVHGMDAFNSKCIFQKLLVQIYQLIQQQIKNGK